MRRSAPTSGETNCGAAAGACASEVSAVPANRTAATRRWRCIRALQRVDVTDCITRPQTLSWPPPGVASARDDSMMRLSALVFAAALLATLTAAAQQVPPGGGGRGGRGPATFPAQQRPPGDPALIARGNGLYGVHCRACHGVDLRGGDQGGPNLLRSDTVLNDQAGELIAPVILSGQQGA